MLHKLQTNADKLMQTNKKERDKGKHSITRLKHFYNSVRVCVHFNNKLLNRI